jgi:hypothetical protein
LRQIADYHNLSNYVRELYQIPGIAETQKALKFAEMEQSHPLDWERLPIDMPDRPAGMLDQRIFYASNSSESSPLQMAPCCRKGRQTARGDLHGKASAIARRQRTTGRF